jgi:hypothetical protein
MPKNVAEKLMVAFIGALASGVLAGGVGMMKWGMEMERRMIVVEMRTGVDGWRK